MNFRTCGEKNNKPLLLIHGLASTASLCFEPLLPYLKDAYVILCELDGHGSSQPDDMQSMLRSVDSIERFIHQELSGKVYGLIGFSMGATMAIELIGRGHITAERVLLNAAITVDMGWMALPFTWIFVLGTDRISKGKAVPKFLLDKMMGKDNRSVIEMMERGVSPTTVRNACADPFRYAVPEHLRDFSNPVLFWHGSEEPYPAKSAQRLRPFLPQMKTEVFPGPGHGQFLHEHPREYAEKLRAFLK